MHVHLYNSEILFLQSRSGSHILVNLNQVELSQFQSRIRSLPTCDHSRLESSKVIDCLKFRPHILKRNKQINQIKFAIQKIRSVPTSRFAKLHVSYFEKKHCCAMHTAKFQLHYLLFIQYSERVVCDRFLNVLNPKLFGSTPDIAVICFEQWFLEMKTTDSPDCTHFNSQFRETFSAPEMLCFRVD